jgi:hypothetical protein
MHGSSRVVPHVTSDRGARLSRFARLVRSRRNEDDRIDLDPVDGWRSESYVPTLRGYPLDPFYANRNR